MSDKSELTKLKGIGPVSEKWLNAVGVYTKEDLEKIGPRRVYEMVKRAGFHPTVNLLYALVGALNGVHWMEVAESIKVEEFFK